MAPILSVGPFALPTYPLAVLLGLWAGMWLAAHRASKLGFDGDHMYNAGLYGLLGGVIGARLWFVLSHWENYAPDPTQALSLSRSALSVPEGLLVAGVIILAYAHRNELPLGHFFDAAAPGLALGLAVFHGGELLGGSQIGAPTALPWAVEIGGLSRHPVQLYQAGACLLILAALLRWRNWRPVPGFHFWAFTALYALSRMLFEIFYANPVRVGDGFLAVQIAALVILVIALASMAYQFTTQTSS